MNNLNNMFVEIQQWLPAVSLLVVGGTAISLFKRFVLNPKEADISDSRWMRQLSLFCITLIFLILILLAMPISETMKGQLFNLLGIAITATIALSSTTFVGNTMAGFMLKAIDGIRPGDFLKVGDHIGRVSEQGLLHTEIQTEDRDLTTLPNLYLVTTPVTVVRSSGTIVSATVSLGYDVPRSKIEKVLCEAGEKSGLTEPFVQILELGDYSVTYRIAGFLKDVKYLISFRSKLRGLMLDLLHENNIEIVSPNFMNQRVYPIEKSFIPSRNKVNSKEKSTSPEDMIFDKADEAQSRERIKEMLQLVDGQLKELESEEFTDEKRSKIERLQKRQEHLANILKIKEEK